MGRTDFEQGEQLEELRLDMSDEELKGLISDWLKLSEDFTSVIENNGKINKDYYKGIDRRTEELDDKRSKTVDNRIFVDLETIVPLVTSKPAKPVVYIPHTKEGQNEAIREQAIKNQKILTAVYDDLKLQHEFEKLVRHQQIYHIGVLKYGTIDGKIFAKTLLPSRILGDSEATDIDDSAFVGEKIVKTAKELIDMFPDKEQEIKEEVSGKLGTKLTYIEWWTDDMKVCSISDRIILEKNKNPLFDYTGIEETKVDEYGKEMKDKTKNNVFNKPKKPYIFFNVYNLGESIIDDTTPLTQSRTLQDNINDRKRQIADNTDKTANPIRAYKGLTAEQSEEADDNLDSGYGVTLADDQDVFYVQPSSVPAIVYNDMQDSRNAIDNLFGIHSTTRGERQGGESGKAREQLRAGDEDRQATIGRALETLSEDLYNAFAHLIKVFYDEEELLPILGGKDSEEFVSFKRDDIADGIRVRVKPGSTIPDDPNSIKAQGLELAQMGKITNRRLFEMLGIEDADEAAKELELEGVKAQLEQEKLMQKEQQEKGKVETANQLQEEIQNLT